MKRKERFNQAEIIKNGEKYYDDMMDDVYLLHHTYPTNLTHMSQTDADLAAQAEADAYARNGKQPQGRKRKKVYFESDPDYCNGLPRRKR